MSSKNHRSTARILLFVFGCLGSRLLLALFTFLIGRSTSDAAETLCFCLGVVCLFTALMFTLLSTGVLKRDTGLEVSGGPIWWANIRWVNAVTYFIAGALLTGNAFMRRQAWTVLTLDVFIGAVAYAVFMLQ